MSNNLIPLNRPWPPGTEVPELVEVISVSFRLGQDDIPLALVLSEVAEALEYAETWQAELVEAAGQTRGVTRDVIISAQRKLIHLLYRLRIALDPDSQGPLH